MSQIRFFLLICLAGIAAFCARNPFYPEASPVSRIKLSPKPLETTKTISLNGIWKLSKIQQSDNRSRTMPILILKTNLDELSRFVWESHNHPCVAMWSLGNEVPNKDRPDIVRQFNKEYECVKECDLQQRPVSIFSGSADWTAYGRNPLKTDVHDLHTYVGLSHPWTNREGDTQNIMTA